VLELIHIQKQEGGEIYPWIKKYAGFYNNSIYINLNVIMELEQ